MWVRRLLRSERSSTSRKTRSSGARAVSICVGAGREQGVAAKLRGAGAKLQVVKRCPRFMGRVLLHFCDFQDQALMWKQIILIIVIISGIGIIIIIIIMVIIIIFIIIIFIIIIIIIIIIMELPTTVLARAHRAACPSNTPVLHGGQPH